MMSIIQAIKDFLKRFLPPPTRAFNREVERLLAAIARSREETAALHCELAQQYAELSELRAETAALSAALERQSTELAEITAVQSAVQQEASVQGKQMRERLAKVDMGLAQTQKTLTEQESRAQMAASEQAERLQENFAIQKTQLQEMLAARMESITECLAANERSNAERLVQFQTLAQSQKAAFADLQAVAKDQGKALTEIQTRQDKISKIAAKTSRTADEAVWAAIFNNTITRSLWLKEKTFSPGRWATGYPALYAIYRVLNEARPKRILELGLGQSTRMIAQYAAAFDDVEHIVVEHDADWIRFFQNDFIFSQRTRVVQLDREMVPYKEAEEVRVFKDFRQTFAGQQFDFIFIDAPLGGDMKQYARIDVLGLLPECLAEEFALMLDDCERSGETHTIAEMERTMQAGGIIFHRGVYHGAKDFMIWTSSNQKFLCSM